MAVSDLGQGLLDVQNAAIAEGATTVAADAAGNAQANATLITKQHIHVSAGDGTKGVRLPPATVGAIYYVANNSVYGLPVYPATGEGIKSSDGTGVGTANLPVNVEPYGVGVFECAVAGTWFAKIGITYSGNNSDFGIGIGTFRCGRLEATYPVTLSESVAAAKLIAAGGLALADSKMLLFGTGDELCVNGAFAADWTKGSGWTIAGGKAVATLASTALVATAAPLTSGRTYKVTYTLTRSAGEVKVMCGTAEGVNRGDIGMPKTFTEIITANGSAFNFTGNGFTGTIDDVSVVLCDVIAYWDGTDLVVSIAGADDFKIRANTFTALAGSKIVTDTIEETTGGSGVTIDSVLLKDGGSTMSGVTLRTGGDKTAMIAVPNGASYAVLAANSGKVHIIADQGQDATLTLPAVAAGLYYEFWHGMEAADGHDWIFNTGADVNYFKGGLLFVDSDAGPVGAEVSTIAGDGNSHSKLQVNLPSTGTVVKMYCDGTNWFLNGTVFSTTIPAFADQ